MKVYNVLQNLGYSLSEAKIYVASLKIGEGTVSDIAAQIDMPRSTVKDLVLDMHKRGLINYYQKRGRKFWFAENPDKLLADFQDREQAFRDAIPSLKLICKNGDFIPKIKTFVGATDIKMIMDDIIETKHNIKAVIDWDDWIGLYGEEYHKDFIVRRVSHNLKIKIIAPPTRMAADLRSRDQAELRLTRFLPDGMPFKTTNFYFGNKVAIISLNKKSPVGVLIEDPDIANTMDLFFEALWSKCRE